MRKIYEFIESILEIISRLALSTAAVITLGIAIIGTLDVITTNVISKPIPGAFELSEAGLAMLVFFGLAITSRSGSHIKVDILTNRLPAWGQRICSAIGYLFTSIIFIFWSRQLYLLAAKSFRFRETATGLFQFPLYIVKIAACVALFFATIETIRRLIIASMTAFMNIPRDKGKQ